jgi:predicted aldo/keto reductase-like oxidoreductase
MSAPAPAPSVAPATSDFLHATLGRTGRRVHRLGLAASYGIDEAGVDEAVERGVNYLYWGSFRTGTFGKGIRNACRRLDRDKVLVVIQSYTRVACTLGLSLRRATRWLGIDHADVLLLGWWNKPPSARMIDAALRLKEEGQVRHIALSTHERPLLPKHAAAGDPFDIFHVRYNAAHRGAEREVLAALPDEPARRPGLVSFTATRWGTLLRPIEGGGALNDRVPSAGDCYRFVLSNPKVDLTLAGPKDRSQLRHALDALEKGPMAEDELSWIRSFGDRVRAESQKAGPLSIAFWRNKSAQ